jgi:hypothetical protein
MENKTLETKKFKKVRTLADIQNDPRVDSVWNEDNSWWCQLVDGYEWAPNSQLIHETSIKEVCSVMNHEVKAVETNEQPSYTLEEILSVTFSRVDEKNKWCWDFKVKGFNFWMTAQKGTDGIWEFITWYDEMQVSRHWDTRKWSGWDIRTEMVAVFFS